MGLRRQIVDLIRLHQMDDADQRRGVRQIAVVELDSVPRNEMIDPRRVGNGGAAGDAVDLIAFLQKEFRQIRTILTGDAGDQCHFTHTTFPLFHICILYHFACPL